MKQNVGRVVPYNIFFLRAKTVLQLVNSAGKPIGSVVLEKDTDILIGFSQPNETGKLISYRTVACEPAKGLYQVQEVPKLK
jgi:hypothetical protein